MKRFMIAAVAVLATVALLAPAVMADENEKPGEEGRPVWVRFFIGAQGMGVVQCNSCSTAAGCNALWISLGSPASCKATPAPGHKFTHWTANGQYAGTDNPRRFGKKGATLKGVFDKN